MKIGKVIYRALGALEWVVEVFSATRRIVKAARQGNLPLNDTDPIPLKRPPPLPPRAPKK